MARTEALTLDVAWHGVDAGSWSTGGDERYVPAPCLD
jgi:hypothetical protein